VPTGRLLVLGKPGAGKTVLLVRLMLDRLSRRSPGDPVPVLVSLASWKPAEQDLVTWLVNQLPIDYPILAEPAPPDTGKMNRAAALLDKKLLIPVLDGLDELPKSVHDKAFYEINWWLEPGNGLVVSCRTEHYLKVVELSKGRPLGDTAGVEVCDLDTDDVRDYLKRDAGWTADRWNPVLRLLGTEIGTKTPVGKALRTPLMVSLARTIYNYAGKDTGSPRDPAELCDEGEYPDAKAVERYLFDAFIQVAYDPHSVEKSCKWSAADATWWLVYLANHLKNLQARIHLEDQPSRWSAADAKRLLAKLTTHLKGTAGEGESTADNDRQTFDFRWWELRYATPRALSGLAVGIVSGLATGFTAGFGEGIGAGIGIGLGVGLLLGLWVRWLVRKRWEHKTEPVQGLVGGLVGGLLGGFVAGPTILLGIEHGLIGIGHARGLTGGLLVGLGVGMGIGPASGFRGGLFGGLFGGLGGGLVGALGIGVGPWAGLVNGVGVGLTAGCSVYLIGRHEPAQGVDWDRIGLVGGIAVGVMVGVTGWFVARPIIGAVAGSIAFLVATPAIGLFATPAKDLETPDPRAVLAQDRRTFLIFGIVVAIATGPIAGLTAGLISATEKKVEPSPEFLLANGWGITLSTSLVLGLSFAFAKSSWGSFTLARCWLALSGKLPWCLMEFLADAHKRGVLRRVGTLYQFRHGDLQRRLTDPDFPVPAKIRRSRVGRAGGQAAAGPGAGPADPGDGEVD
jgi:NACHT domain